MDKGGNLVGGDDAGEQTRQVLENIKAVIEAAGGSMADIAFNLIFLSDLANYQKMNAVFDELHTYRGRQGADIASFSNRPAVPEAVVAAAKAALDEAWSSAYTDSAGLPELRQAIARQLASECGFEADPEDQIMVTAGGKEGIFAALFATVNPGDEVVIPDPSWVTYDPCVGFAGGIPVAVPSPVENDFHPDPEAIEAAVTAKTKMIVLTTPHNPPGAVLKRDTLEAIAEIAQRHQLLVLSDECYRHYLYDNHQHFSIASLPGMALRHHGRDAQDPPACGRLR